MSNKGRTPNNDEIKLWDAVAKTVRPMHDSLETPLPVSVPQPKDKSRVREKSQSIAQRDDGSTKHHKPSPQPSQLDRRTAEKLRKGKMPVEAILDLHGMTQDQAHSALKGFVSRAFEQQKRCVLVITGKGLRSDGDGVLKTRLPLWLSLEPLCNMVLQSTPAHKKHGGGGAFYLYLKRLRP